MPDTIQFPNYYAQANDRAMAAQKLAQAQALTQGIQLENAQAQKTAQRADQFMMAMQQQQQQNPQATWHDKIAGATDAAIKSGDFADADKLIGVWSKASDQEAKALADGQKAVAEDIANKQKKFAQQASFLSGVSSQPDLDARRQAYKQAYGEDLPFQQFTPGMDKRFEDISISALDRAKIISEQMKAKTDQIRASAEASRDAAAAALDREKINTERTIQEKNTKEGALFAAKADPNSGVGGGGGAINQRLAGRQFEGMTAAEAHITNMASLPAGTGVGTFGDIAARYNKSGADALGGLTARKMTPAANRAFQQEASGLEVELGVLATSGSAGGASAHIVKDLQAMRPKEGDPPIVAANYLALAKQALQVANKGFQVWPGATPRQKQEAEETVAKLDKAVPWTVADVNKHITGDRKTASASYSEMLSKSSLPGSTADSPIPYDPGDTHVKGQYYKLPDGTIVKYKGE